MDCEESLCMWSKNHTQDKSKCQLKTDMSLIVVPCHSIWKAAINDNDPLNLGQLPEQWILAHFQLEHKEHVTMIKHGLHAVLELTKRLKSGNAIDCLLLFSGSKTKSEIDLSEAESYDHLIKKILMYNESQLSYLDLFQDQSMCDLIHTVKKAISSIAPLDDFWERNVSTEECALDSFENLYYSLLKYHDTFQRYPEEITFVGFEFKRTRVADLHGKQALGVDVNYIGINPEPQGLSEEMSEKYFSNMAFQEHKNALVHFEKDWYGVKDPLSSKKVERNTFRVFPSYKQLVSLTHDNDVSELEFYTNVVKPKYNNFRNSS